MVRFSGTLNPALREGDMEIEEIFSAKPIASEMRGGSES